MPRVRWLCRMLPWNQLWRVLSAGIGSAIQSPVTASADNAGDKAETRLNQNADRGVATTNSRMSVVPAANSHVKRSSLGLEPGSSSSATTTSLRAIPSPRTMKTSPVTTGQTASEFTGCGMRLSAALPMGSASNTSKDVSTSGK